MHPSVGADGPAQPSVGASGLARDAGGDGLDAIAGKPAPTSCLRSHAYTDGCRDLGGSWLASDRALSGAACIAGKPTQGPAIACNAVIRLRVWGRSLPRRQTGHDWAQKTHEVRLQAYPSVAPLRPTSRPSLNEENAPSPAGVPAVRSTATAAPGHRSATRRAPGRTALPRGTPAAGRGWPAPHSPPPSAPPAA